MKEKISTIFMAIFLVVITSANVGAYGNIKDREFTFNFRNSFKVYENLLHRKNVDII